MLGGMRGQVNERGGVGDISKRVVWSIRLLACPLGFVFCNQLSRQYPDLLARYFLWLSATVRPALSI
jgi:hypothetical protein